MGQGMRSVQKSRRNKHGVTSMEMDLCLFQMENQFPLLQVEDFCLGMPMQKQYGRFTRSKGRMIQRIGLGICHMEDGFKIRSHTSTSMA